MSKYEKNVYTVNSPAPIGPLPSTNQVNWQKMGLTAFCHVGINTFTGKEWGDGTEDPNLFNPTQLDAAQWVTALQNAGFKELILTCKHHDGFCLWPSAYTTHSVASSSWYAAREAAKPGSGDVVKCVADACHAAGMKFGIYLSPWDRNNPAYGTGAPYNKYYENQLTELLTNYGEVGEVWWDGAKGDNIPQTYDFPTWANIVHTLQPNAIIYGDADWDVSEVRWVGNEIGHAPDPCWSALDANYNPTPSGVVWKPAESPVSIRPRWFYHQSDNTKLKSAKDLATIYKDTTGRNSQLLLNVPPDTRGLISDYDVNRLNEFHTYLVNTFRSDLAQGAVATASDTRGTGYEASKVFDNDPNTYWAASDGVTSATLTLDLGSTKTFNIVKLKEPIYLGLRVTGYTIDIWDGSTWNTVATKRCIGNEALVQFSAVTASKVRLNITSARACPAIQTMSVYYEVPFTGMINNTDTTMIQYHGTWNYSSGRGYGDYRDDVHFTNNNNDYCQITFVGTGIEYITEKYSDEGDVDVYLDGVKQTTVNCNSSTRLAQQTVYSVTGLNNATHTLKLVKTSGICMLVDAFYVYGPTLPQYRRD